MDAKTASDAVFTVLNDGRVVKGNIVFVTAEQVLHPGEALQCEFKMPNTTNIRVVGALILLDEDRETIHLPGGIRLDA